MAATYASHTTAKAVQESAEEYMYAESKVATVTMQHVNTIKCQAQVRSLSDRRSHSSIHVSVNSVCCICFVANSGKLTSIIFCMYSVALSVLTCQ